MQHKTRKTASPGLPHEVKAAILNALLDQGHTVKSRRGYSMELDGVPMQWGRAARIAGLDAKTGKPLPSPESEIEELRRRQ